MPFRIKQLFPGRTGVLAALHDLEAAVMEACWSAQAGETSVRDLQEALKPERELAYTTVMTTMDRLAKRDLLLRRKQGRAWLYRPAMDRDAFLATIARQALDGLPDGARPSAMAWFVDEVSEADADQLDFLAELIERKRAERGRG